MLILISPAKTLDFDTTNVLTSHSRPQFLRDAAELVAMDLEHPETIQGRDFLLTYHRSGTNLTLGILPLDVSPSARA